MSRLTKIIFIIYVLALLLGPPKVYPAACAFANPGNGFGCSQITTGALVGTGGGGVATLTLGATATAGHLGILWASNLTTIATATVTDSASVTWTKAWGSNTACSINSIGCVAWYNCNIGAITTVSLNDSTFSNVNMFYVEYSGNDHTTITSCLDQSAAPNSSTGSPGSSPSVTPTAGLTELLVSPLWGTVSNATVTGTNSWENQGNLQDATSPAELSILDLTVASTTGSYSSSWTVSSGNTQGGMLTFKAVAAGAATGVTLVGPTEIIGPTIIN